MNTPDLIVLTDADYRRLRRELKEAGLDLCYMAQSHQPVRLKWSPDLFQRADFLQHLAQRRPADPNYRVASVSLLKKATWFQPTSSPSPSTPSVTCKLPTWKNT